ncbi:MAG TPA: dihydrodipicolinate reductase C-terminal domain-containing protein [Anaerovoracaceae bacterium]|nr:dihydrodipicolinate reductase C-terminal domain-containing protein [Anaerovoracaceae bacterium]
MDIAIHGCCGKMGQMLSKTIGKQGNHNIVFGVDRDIDNNMPYPVYQNFNAACPDVDVVIDFSHHTAIQDLLRWCLIHNKPVVISTTGLDLEEHRIIQEAAKQIPIFLSPNMSVGVNILCKVLPAIADALGSEFDAGIVESHHKKKKDSPSGTAYLLSDSLGGKCQNVSALRIGSIPGEHTVIFAGPDEVIKITHTAYSRKIFALGAIKAASFIAEKGPGLYCMNDM